jgi:DNA-binding response OmpR family regulator
MPAAGRRITALVVGHEPMLRETYALLFERAGYVAEHAQLGSSPALLKATKFALLVMDHTLSREERKSLVPVARHLSPGIKIVALHSSARDCGADLVMDSREGASAILERVAVLLGGSTGAATSG